MSEENKKEENTKEEKHEEKLEAKQGKKAKKEAEVEEVKVEEPYSPQAVTMENLLACGAHFGHRAERWNPKMLPFIYGKKGGVHVINLDITMDFWLKAQPKIRTAAKRGSSFLFVGTKEQSKKVIRSAAERAGVHYVNNRWLGGMLTNFQTIRKSINKMEALEGLLKKANNPDSEVKLAKKEQLQITRNLEKLSANLEGIRKMKRIPDYIFVVDIIRDSIAVEEATKLRIPVIALVDTNTDPKLVDWPIPANDDSRKTIELFVNAIADQIADAKSEITTAAKAVASQPKKQQQPDVDKDLKVERVSSPS